MKEILKASIFTPTSTGWGLPLLFSGPPGVAKTAIVRQIGAEYGLVTEILSPGERGEGAFGVTPIPRDIDGAMTLDYPAPSWASPMLAGQPGLILVDEINTAPPALQPALMGAVLDRRFGGVALPGSVRILGACNPIEHAAGAWDLAAPVANRFGHVAWIPPTADAWADWITGTAQTTIETADLTAEEDRVMALWPAAYAAACSSVAAFIRRRPELLHKMPADDTPGQSGAWPSPRTWEYFARALASAELHGLDAEKADILSAGFVGLDAAGEYAMWLRSQDLPNPRDLLEGRITWTHDPVRLDRTHAVLQGCLGVVDQSPKADKQRLADALWLVLEGLTGQCKDLVIPPASALVKSGLGGGETAARVSASLVGILQAGLGRGMLEGE